MNKYLVGIFVVFTSLVHAKQVGYLQDPKEEGGARVVFTDEQWECPDNIFKFEVFDDVGLKQIEGCWKGIGDNVYMITSNGTKFMMPAGKITWESK